MTEPTILTVGLSYKESVGLEDFTKSLQALDRQFKRFATSHDDTIDSENFGFRIAAIREGSIIADLVGFADQVSIIWDMREVLIGFLSNWNEVTNLLLEEKATRKQLPAELKASDWRDVAAIVDPTAKDEASQYNMVVTDGGVAFVNCTFNNVEADKIAYRARQIAAQKELPQSMMFKHELMLMYQAKNDPTADTGDLAIIDAVFKRPLKVVFANEEAKAAVLEEDVFHTAYIVSGSTKVVEGNPRAYVISEVHSVTSR